MCKKKSGGNLPGSFLDSHSFDVFCAVVDLLHQLRGVQSAAQAAPVPDFTLQLLDGKSISLKDYRGKPVLVNFFHSK